MPKGFHPSVVTASDLLDGDVVYLTAADQWTRDLCHAELIEDEAHAQMRLIFGEAQGNTVVGVYLAEMTQGPDGPQPIHFREDFRRVGPSNYAHGKQEGAAHV